MCYKWIPLSFYYSHDMYDACIKDQDSVGRTLSVLVLFSNYPKLRPNGSNLLIFGSN